MDDRFYHGIFTRTNHYGKPIEVIKTLLAELPWHHLLHKDGSPKRSSCWMTHGKCSCKYKYGGTQWKPTTMPQWTVDLARRLLELCGIPLTFTLDGLVANMYSDGFQGLWWHSDDEDIFKTKASNVTIISLTIGAQRPFLLKKKFWSQPQDNIDTDGFRSKSLCSGDILVMTGHLQDHWQHSVPYHHSSSNTRYNLTFRFISNHHPSCPSRRFTKTRCFTGVCSPGIDDVTS